MGVCPGAADARRKELLRAADNLPPLSPVVNLLLAKLSREDVRFAEVSELIEKDTVLAADLLQTVNSALYGLAGTINSVRHGLSVIGLEKARNIALAASVARFWRKEPSAGFWSGPRFNTHSVATALLADLLAQRMAVDYAEGAFTAGLFHDIGKYLAASALPAEFDSVQRLLAGGTVDADEAEVRHYGIPHGELAAAALGRWNLPAPIVEAVCRHHHPERLRHGRIPLSLVIQAADHCVNRMGMGYASSNPCENGNAADSLEKLGLGEGVQRVLEAFEAEFEIVRGVL